MRIARGVQNKVIEALALGVPVVATPLAIEGIDVRNEDEVLIGADRDEFANQVVRLIRDADFRNGMTKRARDKMNQCYNWDAIGAKLEQLLGSIPASNLSVQVVSRISALQNGG